jgi:hypothetical protein
MKCERSDCAPALAQIHSDLRQIFGLLVVIALAAGGLNVWRESNRVIPELGSVLTSTR